MNSPLLETRYRGSPDVIAEPADDALILLHAQTGGYYQLNRVARRIFELCDGDADVDAIVTRICDEFGAPRERVEPDVLASLETLRDAHLVVERAADPHA